MQDAFHSRWRLLAGTIVLAAGLLTGLSVYPRKEAARLQELLVDAQRCAVAFSDHHLSPLRGTRADLDSPDYREVKSLLIRLREVDARIRFAYLMRRVPGTAEVIFLADSEPSTSEDISLPGDPYPEAATSPGLQEVLRSGAPSTEGPLQDSFGSWVTGYAVVRRADDGTVLDVAGLDIDARSWTRDLWLSTALAVGGVWFALGLPLVIYHVMSRQLQLTNTIRRLSLALDQSSVAVAIVDLQGKLEFVNRGFCRQLGYERAEALGRTWRDLGLVEMEPERLAEVISTLQAGRSWHGQWQNRRRDGTVYPARGGVSPVRGDDQRKVLHVAVFDDITELMQAETGLRAAKQQAEDASAAKTHFLAMMSHEIRTPLNGVIGMTSLLRQTPLSPAQQESVNVIDASSEALLGIIDDILNLTKIEAGKLDVRSTRFAFAPLVQDVLQLLQPAAAAKGIQLQLDAGPAISVPATIIGDPGRLRQILLNLIGNAVKFTDEGTVAVIVSFDRISSEQGRLTVAVRDSGPGIPWARQRELFKPFAQLDTSTTRRFGGTGLGLAISRRLCELMGGSITVDSDGCSGSTFTFTIQVGLDPVLAEADATEAPISLATTPDAAPGPVIETPDVGNPPEQQAVRVLLVEDNAVNALVAHRMLSSLGHAADEARTGYEAIAACQRQDYDVILMDLQMPDLDGLAATAAIRALPLTVRPWIIAVTAEAMEGDRDRCLANGMDDYLSKPLTLPRLAQRLERFRDDAHCLAGGA